MPLIYQGSCSQCSFKTPIHTAAYGCVWVDQPIPDLPSHSEVAGAVLDTTGPVEFAQVDDPRFVVLTHPLESVILERTGYTDRELQRQGRYVIATNMICQGCGTVFPRRRLASMGGQGCLVGLLSGLACGLAAWFWLQSFLAGYVVFFAVACGILYLSERADRRFIQQRFAEKARLLESERQCPHCGAEDAVPIDRAKNVICPQCQHKSLSFDSVGIS